MNGNSYELLEDELEALGDVGDYESDDELAAFLEEEEAVRRRRRPVRTGRGAGYYRARPSGRYVTQTQLQSALGKISKDVKANAVGIKTVGGRVDAVSAEQKKQGEVLKKQAGERKQEIGKLKSGLQMASILPLVTSKPPITTTATDTIGGVSVATGTKIAIAPDALTALLPMFLLGDGLGGSSSGSGGNSGGDSSNMLILLLALSGGLTK